jgi:monoamine oxidase
MGVPLGTFAKINIEELSAGKRLVTQNQITCNMTRMAMVFKEPFWRKEFAGYVSFSHNFPMNEIVDLTPHS